MFDRRLIKLVPGVVPYIAAAVAFKWLALAMNIVVILALGELFAGLLHGGLSLDAGLFGAVVSAPLGGLAAVPAPLAIVCAVAVRSLSVFAAQRMGDKAAYLAKREVRQRVYDKLASMGPAYAEEVSTAEAVQTSVEGAQQLEVYFGGYLPQIFYAVLAPITLFFVLSRRAGLPATVLLAIVPLIPISIMLVMRNAKKVAAEYWDSYVDLGGSFLEAVQGLTTLKIYRADARWHERMNREAEGFRQATMKMLRVQLNSINVMDLVAFGGAAAGIVLAVWQLANGMIGFSGAFSVVFLSQEFFLPMRRLGSLFHTAMNGMSAAKTMFRILDAPEPPAGTAELDGAGDIVCRGLGYAYGDRTVLDGVDVRIPSGSFTAVVGESGSGKSTLAGILSGRKAAYAGSVAIGDVELSQAARGSLMGAVTLVPTNGHLFRGTVRENLALAAPRATDGELWRALERCRAGVFVRAAGGLDAPVAEGGSNFSGGQRQRLCAARALLHDTPIYIFDEATSNVDVESERAIDQVMHGLAGERTVLVIAHRLASVTRADQILVMDGGRLVEQGTHAELIARGGRYAELWASQAALEAEAGATDADAAVAVDAEYGWPSAGPAVSSADSPAPVARATGSAPVRRSGARIMGRMIGLVRPLLPYLLLAIALGSAGSLAATFLAAFGAYGLMAASGRELALTAGSACLLVAACGIVRGPLHYGEQLCNHYIAFRLLAHIRDLVFAQLRRLAPAKLEGRGRGDLISLATSDIELLEVFYAHTISPIAIACVTCLVMLVFIGAHSIALAALALAGYLLLGVVAPLASARFCGDAGRASRDGAGAISAYVLDGLRGLAESIQFGGAEARSRGLWERTEQVGGVDRALHWRSAVVEGLADAAVLLLSLAMIALALSRCAVGELSLEAAFICSFAFFSSFGPVLAVARLGTSLQATLASGARVLDLLDEEPQTAEVSLRDPGAVAVDPDEFSGAAFEDVTFSYAGGPGSAAAPAAATAPAVLQNISFDIPAGQMTSISGPSGCGKSTLLKLLMRFWDPTAGTVRISGEDVRCMTTESLRACEAYMTQETHLFIGTVGDNLRIARADATDEELDAACAAASLTALISRLPQGYETPVAELGDSLSGGERQRIGLARVFLHDAPLVLLDEPTSNLDALNEAAVMRAVAGLRAQGKTIVLVSHRASTAGFADRTIALR